MSISRKEAIKRNIEVHNQFCQTSKEKKWLLQSAGKISLDRKPATGKERSVLISSQTFVYCAG